MAASMASVTSTARIVVGIGLMDTAIPTSRSHQGEMGMLRNGKTGLNGTKEQNPKAKERIEARAQDADRKAKGMGASIKDMETKINML